MISTIIRRNNLIKNVLILTNKRSYCSNTNGVSTEVSDLPIHFHRDLTSNKDIFLIGTIHVSKNSANQVQKFIQDVKPGAVVLELCDARYRKIRNDIDTQDISSYQAPPPSDSNGSSGSMNSLFEKIGNSMRSGNFSPTMIYDLITKHFYNSFKVMGLLPGLEFYLAIKEADKLGIEIINGDINSKDTLNKLMGAMNSEILPFAQQNNTSPELERLNRLLTPLTSKLTKSNVTEKELEIEFKKILNNKTLKEIREIFEKELPITYEAMLIGRERNLVREIKQCKANSVVCVVGALHVEGVKQLLNLSLDKIPKPLPPPPASSLLGLLGGSLGGGLGGMGNFGKFLK